MGASRAAGGRRHGRLQPRRDRRGTLRGTRDTGCLRRLRPGRRGRPRSPPGGPQAPTDRPVRIVVGGRRRLHGPGLGPYRRRRNRLLGVRARRRDRLRGARRARPAAARTAPALRDGVRARGGRVGGGRGARRRPRLAAHAGLDGGRRTAVAGGDRHGRRLRLLVHGHAAHRRGARDALLRPHPGGRGLHGPARRNGLLRSGAGRGQRAGRRRSRPGVGRVDPAEAKLSGCRPG